MAEPAIETVLIDDEPSMEYNQKRKFPLSDQKVIGKFLADRKRKFAEDTKNPEINKSVWNAKRKKWTSPFTQKGYIQPSVRQLFTNLKGETCDQKNFKSATKFVVRCMEKYERGQFDIEGNDSSKKFRLAGAGAPKRALEVRTALFEYFVDVRYTLKGRLPRFLLASKAKELYDTYCELKRDAGETPEDLTISPSWIDRWCNDFGVSLKHPNKRFSVSHDVRKRRIIQFLKNMWTVRYFWLQHYKREPNIVSADQMPIHRNESSAQKTLNFSGRNVSCFVKENTSLSRERCTVMTIVSSCPEKSRVPPAEFVFKGKGLRLREKIAPPGKIQVQWAEKGSYRLQHVLEFIERLPKIHTIFKPGDRDVFTLDDYSAHLPLEVQSALHKKGYFLVNIGGGITGDVQLNDTDYHRPLKMAYREKEMILMVERLKENPNKIPSPSRNEMMKLFDDAWGEVYERIDNVTAYKRNMITLPFDGSEDVLASRQLMDLVGVEMMEFRKELLNSEPPATIKELRKQIIKPEGVRYKDSTNPVPPDEGIELFDGEEMLNMEENDGDEHSDDGEIVTTDEGNDANVNDNPTTSAEGSIAPINEDIVRLDQIGDLIKVVKSTSSNTLLPHLIKMEGIYMNIRRKLLKNSKIDGILQNALNTVALGQGEENEEETGSESPASSLSDLQVPAIIRDEDLFEEDELFNMDEGSDPTDNIFDKIQLL